MGARFEFATSARILFGPNTVAEVGALAAEMGRRALVLTGRNPQRAAPLLKSLEAESVKAVVHSTPGEPTTSSVQAGVEAARKAGCDLVVGIGGGSVIDAAKAVAALLSNGGDPLDYLEVIGRGLPLERPSAPCIAIPTTAGTGAEVTRNAVLGSPEHRVKVSMRSPHMLPRLAVVDPLLTHSAPPEVTANAGLDALTQLIEAFVTNQANPLTDGVCREGIQRAARSLRQAFEDGANESAREDMALASLFGGLALANAKLGAVHGFAGPLGGMFEAPHGAVCARLLPYVMETNINALRQRAPNSPALLRYAETARLLTGNPESSASDGAAWTHDLCAALRIKPLAAHDITQEDVADIVAKSRKASSMKGNPVELSEEELTRILKQAL
jgi:alcohol dehydrogenase class IV